MRHIRGRLTFEYTTGSSCVFLAGHEKPFVFDKGLELGISIPSGSEVILTLINLPGPNPANSSKTSYDVERIVATRLCVRPETTSHVLTQTVSAG